jgi:hypothetical protein
LCRDYVSHATRPMGVPECSNLESPNLLARRFGRTEAHSMTASSASLPFLDRLHCTWLRLLKNLPDSMEALLDLASQSHAAHAAKPLPVVAAQHQAVQQELILGEADRWRRLLVRLLPSLKQVCCPWLCPPKAQQDGCPHSPKAGVCTVPQGPLYGAGRR